MHRIWNWHIITSVEILRAECCSALSSNDNHKWWVYSAGGGQEGLLMQGTFFATSHYASAALSLQITAGERQSRGDWGSPIPSLSLRWPSYILLSPSHSGWMTLILSWFQIKSHTGVHSSLSSSLLSPSLSLSLSLSLSRYKTRLLGLISVAAFYHTESFNASKGTVVTSVHWCWIWSICASLSPLFSARCA